MFGSILVGLLHSCCTGLRRASFLSLCVKPLLTRVGAVLLSLRIRGRHRAGHEAHPGWDSTRGVLLSFTCHWGCLAATVSILS